LGEQSVERVRNPEDAALMVAVGTPPVVTALPAAEKRHRERNLGRCESCMQRRSGHFGVPTSWQRRPATYFGETLKENRSLREDVSASKEAGQVPLRNPMVNVLLSLEAENKWRRGQRENPIVTHGTTLLRL
jgi:hypothetical protein